MSVSCLGFLVTKVWFHILTYNALKSLLRGFLQVMPGSPGRYPGAPRMGRQSGGLRH